MKKYKKNRKKYMLSFLTTAVFLGILMGPGITWGILSLTGGTEALDFDLQENRNKAELPTEFRASTFCEEVEAYYNDRVPYRSVIITENNKLNGALEAQYKEKVQPILLSLFYGEGDLTTSDTLASMDGMDDLLGGGATPAPTVQPTPTAPLVIEHVYAESDRMEATCLENGYVTYVCEECGDSYTDILAALGHDFQVLEIKEADYDNYGYTYQKCSVCALEQKTDFTEKLIDTSYLPPNVINECTIEGRRNWLFYAGNGSVSYYRGTNLYSEETLIDYVSRVETLQGVCDELGIQLQLMVIPNKEQVYAEYMPSYTIEDTYKRVPRMIDYVKEETGEEILYPLKELQAGKLYWQVYHKYDTHWNSAGAFLGCQVLYKSLGIPTTSITDVEYDTEMNSGGDLQILGALDINNYTKDMIYDISYREDVTVLESTGNRTGTGTVCTKSDSENICNFVLIGDSFRNQMIEYLEKDFSDCLFTHRDHLTDEKVINAIKNADVLVVTAVERYDNRLMNSITTITEILNGTLETSKETDTKSQN